MRSREGKSEYKAGDASAHPIIQHHPMPNNYQTDLPDSYSPTQLAPTQLAG
jgi:hypothetical protein